MEFWEAVKEYFEINTKLAGMAAGTVEAYRSDFRDFLRFLDVRDKTRVEEITTADVNAYLLSLRKRSLKISTVHRRKNALSSLLGFCVQQGWTDSNPVLRVKLQPKPRASRNVVLSDEEVRAFLKSQATYRTVDASTIEAVKALMVFTGLRCSEIVNADWRHVDLERALLTVYNSKNTLRKGLPDGKDRDIPLCTFVLKALNALPRREGPLLQTKRGRRLTTDAVEEVVSRLSRAVGLERGGKALTPHCFRHNLASQLVAHGYSEADVSALLGHKAASVTQAYIHSTFERLREAVQAYDDAITVGHMASTAETSTQEPEVQKGLISVGLVDEVLKEAHRWWLLLSGDTPVPEPFLIGFVAGRRSAKAM